MSSVGEAEDCLDNLLRAIVSFINLQSVKYKPIKESVMARIELLEDELDLAGVHAVLSPEGRVLFFAADPPRENNVNVSLFQLWDEENGPDEDGSQEISRNLFCSGHCFLPDGRLLIAGGQSWNTAFTGADGSLLPEDGADHDIHTFDFDSEEFTRHDNMPGARYYPTCVTLPDGNALICSGAWSRSDALELSPSINHEAEIFYWETDVKGTPFTFNPGFIETMYPFLQVLPAEDGLGRLFVFSKNRARLFNLNRGEWRSGEFPALSNKNRNYHSQGSCVLLPFHVTERYFRIMVIGGEGASHGVATDTAEIFEYDREQPSDSGWREPFGGVMANKRFMGDAVIMADGKILLVNGAEEGEADHSGVPVMETEIYDPVSETWETSAELEKRRMYHSTALLLPSGKVLIAGNTERWNENNPVEEKSIELFIPDYVDSDSRPELTKVPEDILYGARFQVSTPNARAIEKVALIRASSTTHTNNMDQRYLTLDFGLIDDETLGVDAPMSGALAPPGHYMVVILDEDGIPSEAKMISLKPSPPDVEATIFVGEGAEDVDTNIDVEPWDQVVISATGTIWAGVWVPGRSGPRGWDNVDHDPKFPLNQGDNAHPYCLIGKFGSDGDYFYVGEACTKLLDSASSRRLFLRTNDDTPGNGNGGFTCEVKVTRRLNLEAEVMIEKVVADTEEPNDLAPGRGEHVVIKNNGSGVANINGWVLKDKAQHEIIIGDYTLLPDQSLLVFIGSGTNGPDRFFAGRGAPILNNTGDTIWLFNANRRLVSLFSY